jgi:hypothetical protein
MEYCKLTGIFDSGIMIVRTYELEKTPSISSPERKSARVIFLFTKKIKIFEEPILGIPKQKKIHGIKLLKFFFFEIPAENVKKVFQNSIPKNSKNIFFGAKISKLLLFFPYP